MNFNSPQQSPELAKALRDEFKSAAEKLADELRDSLEKAAEFGGDVWSAELASAAKRVTGELSPLQDAAKVLGASFKDAKEQQEKSTKGLQNLLLAFNAIQTLARAGNPHFTGAVSGAGNAVIGAAQIASGNPAGGMASLASAAADLTKHFENLARAASPDKLAFLDKSRGLAAAGAGIAEIPNQVNKALIALEESRATEKMGSFKAFGYHVGAEIAGALGFNAKQKGADKVEDLKALRAEAQRGFGGAAGFSGLEDAFKNIQTQSDQSPLDKRLLEINEEVLLKFDRLIAAAEKESGVIH